MLPDKFLFPALLISFILTTSCGQNEGTTHVEKPTVEQPKHQEPHSYGGWFCPDNFGGFPPIDVQHLDQVPVVADRLPTKEETSNGTSLMYFDPTEYPDAKPLEMALPQVARIHSKHNGINELIIVIQAAVIGVDTVVGYRFPSGGNGTAWYKEVSFLSDQEADDLGPAPMVYHSMEISASKENIWKAIAQTEYAQQLATLFDKKAFFESDWTNESGVDLRYETENERATGIVADVWGNLFVHIDYDYQGFHYAEKVLLLENAAENTCELHIASGPFPKDFEAENTVWKNWLQEVKTLSEKK